MDKEVRRDEVAIRLEGGIGDHVLGMRLLPFIRQRYPRHRLMLYSDAAGSAAQLDVARMSPHAAEVHAIAQRPGAATYETMGSLSNLREDDLRRMLAAEAFFDAWGATYFLPAARALGVPFYEILAARPDLQVPAEAIEEAERILQPYSGHRIVALHLAKFGAGFLPRAPMLNRLIEDLLQQEDVVLLNIFQRSFDFTHWPAAIAEQRLAIALSDSEALESLSRSHPRIVPMVDLPVTVVAAILSKSRYFVGVDNGIKHLAWALGVPLTFFMPELPAGDFILRWLPDYHRLLAADCAEPELEDHLEQARSAIARETSGFAIPPPAILPP